MSGFRACCLRCVLALNGGGCARLFFHSINHGLNTSMESSSLRAYVCLKVGFLLISSAFFSWGDNDTQLTLCESLDLFFAASQIQHTVFLTPSSAVGV